MNKYVPRDYWTRLAKDFARSDANGFAPVLHPGVPTWFNEIIDRLQRKALDRALSACDFAKDAHLLDVGCGTGRWVRRLGERGFFAVGIDQSLAMLRLARETGTLSPLFVGEVQSLPFEDESFDCVSVITVIQHIPPTQQIDALKEMIRVLRPTGYLILFELTRGRGPHVFSRRPTDWIHQVSSLGPRLVLSFGQEFLILDRVLMFFLQQLRTLKGKTTSETLPGKSENARNSSRLQIVARRIYWTFRKVTVASSAWIEPLAERVCPDSFATHGIFLFQKDKRE